MESNDYLKSDKRVLIIGGTGFIGYSLYKHLTKKNYIVEIIGKKTNYVNKSIKYYTVDILNEIQLEKFFDEHRYDYIFHFAAVMNVDESLEQPKRYFKINSIGTLNLLEAIRKYQPDSKIIFNSTGLVYGNTDMLPIKETNPVTPNNPYAHSKFVAEEIIKAYSFNYNIPSIVFRLFTVYGPKQNSPMFIPSFIRRCLTEKTVRIGNIDVTRDFIFIDDLIALYEQVLKTDFIGYDIFNVASGEETKISELAEIILKLTNRKKNELIQDLNLKRNKKNELNRVFVDIDKVKRTFQWKPKIPIKEGIKLTIDSYKNT